MLSFTFYRPMAWCFLNAGVCWGIKNTGRKQKQQYITEKIQGWYDALIWRILYSVTMCVVGRKGRIYKWGQAKGKIHERNNCFSHSRKSSDLSGMIWSCRVFSPAMPQHLHPRCQSACQSAPRRPGPHTHGPFTSYYLCLTYSVGDLGQIASVFYRMKGLVWSLGVL